MAGLSQLSANPYLDLSDNPEANGHLPFFYDNGWHSSLYAMGDDQRSGVAS